MEAEGAGETAWLEALGEESGIAAVEEVSSAPCVTRPTH